MFGKEKRLSLGVYPEVSLKEAREKRENLKRLIAEGIDPSEHRKTTKQHQQAAIENSFEAIAREWWSKFKTKWSATHALHVISSLADPYSVLLLLNFQASYIKKLRQFYDKGSRYLH